MTDKQKKVRDMLGEMNKQLRDMGIDNVIILADVDGECCSLPTGEARVLMEMITLLIANNPELKIAAEMQAQDVVEGSENFNMLPPDIDGVSFH